MKTMKQYFRLNYTQKIILSLFIVILLLSIILSISLRYLSEKKLTATQQELLITNLDSVASQVTNALNTARDATTPILSQIDIPALCSSTSQHDILDNPNAKYSAEQMLQSIIDANISKPGSSISYIGLYLNNNDIIETGHFISAPSFSNFDECCSIIQDYCLSSLEGYTRTLWFDSAKVSTTHAGDSKCIIGVRFVYSQPSLEKIAAIVIGVSETSLRDIFSLSDAPMCLMRQDGTILLSTPDYSHKEHKNYYTTLEPQIRAYPQAKLTPYGDQYIYSTPIQDNTLWLVCIPDLSNQLDTSRSFSYQTAIITTFTLILGLLLVWICSNRLTKSLRGLTAIVQKLYDGDLSVRFHTTQDDEIAYLGLKINDMVQKIQDSLLAQKRDDAIKLDLALQLAQAQINPHLLYNTLNIVVLRINQNDPQKATQLIFALSNFFQLTLSNGREEIPLEDEISMIKYYIQLQNLGCDNEYSLRIDVPEELRHYKVLRLTLQPLVENSVIHGLSEWRNNGELLITAETDIASNSLCVRVRDNGIGIQSDELQQLRHLLDTYPFTKSTKHYGLYNIQQRLKMKYGPQYGLTIDSIVGEYTEVTITYPIDKEDDYA